jgi:hypothetical protein
MSLVLIDGRDLIRQFHVHPDDALRLKSRLLACDPHWQVKQQLWAALNASAKTAFQTNETPGYTSHRP